jgi:hypothetical protein
MKYLSWQQPKKKPIASSTYIQLKHKRKVGTNHNGTKVLRLKTLKQEIQIFSEHFVHALPNQSCKVDTTSQKLQSTEIKRRKETQDHLHKFLE